jgi:uncharacterized protein YggU (UPF0235/DUF167 family)
MVDCSKTSPTVKIQVKVVAGAANSAVAGWLGDRLKLRISAQPERGKANAAVEALIADALELPESAIRIVAGQTSARKTVEVTGLTDTVVKTKLGRSV